MDMQLFLNAVYNWYVKSKLPLNIGKCAVFSFYRGRGFFVTKYTMNNEDHFSLVTMLKLQSQQSNMVLRRTGMLTMQF